MNTIVEKAKNLNCLRVNEIEALLNDAAINTELFKAADEVRKTSVGDEVHLRGLLEISNICNCNCKYCGIRRDNKEVTRYKLEKEEIKKLINNAVQLGYKTIVLQSGEAKNYSADEFTEIISFIKSFNIAVTLSLGEKTFEEYKLFKDAGADRYLLRIETTDENLYKEMHPDMSLENRKRCLSDLKQLGYEVGTGCLVGLPNQTLNSLANDILFFKEINADMIGIGPFIPAQNTPLENASHGNVELSLKVMAITRLLLPKINIPATTAMEVLEKGTKWKALNCGANVIMPNITDEISKSKYSIYPNKSNDDVILTRDDITKKLETMGRYISKTKGQSKNWKIE